MITLNSLSLKHLPAKISRTLSRQSLLTTVAISGAAGIVTGVSIVAVMTLFNQPAKPAPTVATRPTPTAIPLPTATPTATPTPTPGKTKAAKVNPPPAAPAAPSHQYGFAPGGGLAHIGNPDLTTKLRAMKAAGASWVRFDLHWEHVQPNGPTQYDWSRYDRIVDAANTVGLKPLILPTYSPAWARTAGCDSDKCAPANPNQFAAFVSAAASRYAGRGVRTWEIWNEPNGTDFWKPAPDIGVYTQLLSASYTAIKRVDPGATVLTGGTASLGTGASNYSPADFLAGIYRHGGGKYFDAVADHPYSYPFLPSYQWEWNAWQQMSATSPNLRSIMTANGDAGKKIWLTEFGAPTRGPGAAASSGLSHSEVDLNHVTEALQAQIVSEAMSLHRSYSWAGPFFWYSFEDSADDASDNQYSYGLLRPDGSRKPSYDAYKRGTEGKR